MQDQNRDYGYNLRNGFVLAVTFSRKDDIFRSGKQSQTGNRQFARDYNDDHPRGDPIQADKCNKRGANHNFVGEWIHQNTEVRYEVSTPRDLAIKKVADSRRRKEEQGECLMQRYFFCEHDD